LELLVVTVARAACAFASDIDDPAEAGFLRPRPSQTEPPQEEGVVRAYLFGLSRD
jgi:hypothetical protein